MLLKPEGLQGGLPFLGRLEGLRRPLQTRRSTDDEQKQRLIAFTKLIDSGHDEEFAREIGSYLDVEAFLTFIAANTLLSNLDSYLGFGHNYYLYLAPGTNKFVFIPWDLDLSLATWPAVGTPEQLVELSIHHPHAGQNKLIDRLFAIEEHKKRYLAIVKELASTCFTEERLLASLEAIETALQDPMATEAQAIAAQKENGAGGGFGFGGGFGGRGGNGQFGQSMPPRKFIEERTQSVAAQLAGQNKGFEPKPIVFGFGPPSRGGGGRRPGERQ